MHILGKETLEQQEETVVAARHSVALVAVDPSLGRADDGRSTEDTKHKANTDAT